MLETLRKHFLFRLFRTTEWVLPARNSSSPLTSRFIRWRCLTMIKLMNRLSKAEIDRLTAGYDDKPRFFIDKLAQGVAMIAAAFYPKEVILRLSDFKTNEYANLIGGRKYEPQEE